MNRSLVFLVLALACAGCESTSSTEVGVRTCLFGILEKRGEQQVYPPGGVYMVMPFVNSWATLPIYQQNLLMNANTDEGDRPVPDDITFKTKDGNNVHIDVNIMWRINPERAADVISRVGHSVDEIKERVIRPVSRATIRDVFNKITSEEYYHVDIKNRVAAEAREMLEKELQPFGILVDSMQVQQHRFDPEYQAAIDAQKQAEADVQTLLEQQKNIVVQKQSELQAKRAEWNQKLEDSRGQAGRIRNEADAYASKRSNAAKALLAQAKAESDATRKEAEALNKLGGDSYVKMQLARQFSGKHIILVPQSNVSTMNINQIMGMILNEKAQQSSTASEPSASSEESKR
ncbi:MAG: SPFH domain-containing protein [Hyalangium sp.]|uniref:SPFH domain-containing protein n=1 Tax=Hyalangium sp. TaxID=2028555 RepID=UPI00389A0FB4